MPNTGAHIACQKNSIATRLLAISAPEAIAKLYVPGTGGVLLTFDDFEKGIEDFGQKIQPLMTCRSNVKAA